MFVLLILFAILVDGVYAFTGFLQIQIMPARLINDYFITANVGAAIINATTVGIIGYLLITITGTNMSGPTFAAIFTMMGFGLFGKTPLNILPIIFGVFLASKYALKTFKDYIIIALFGTAIGPIVSVIAFELGLNFPLTIIAGIGSGIIAGFLLPSLAVAMLHLHQGYNLYNMGLTCGFLSLFLASLIKSRGNSLPSTTYWLEGQPLILSLIIPIISITLITIGLAKGGLKSLKSFIAIQKIPGRLPSDFIDIESIEGSFINAGFIGLIGTAYTYITRGDFNGPVIGGRLTIMGFSAFGTNLKNAWPVAVGVIITALLLKKPLTSPGVQLAVIFCTTLGPIAGQFGIKAGIIAGAMHLIMVSQTGIWQGGINLYNNGFAGGLTATLIVAIVQWYRTNRKDNKKWKKQN